tara:strand:- start:1564 stop:1965 length:402 start_codon:yes stop_codon:yes gene_type:complete
MARNLPPDPAAQRDAMRLWLDRHGDPQIFVDRYDIAPRQVERFLSAAQMMPPGLCRDIATHESERVEPGMFDSVAAAFATLADSHATARDRQRAARGDGAFGKIADGLEDAIDFANGDRTRGRVARQSKRTES